jgi:hypothetical protein
MRPPELGAMIEIADVGGLHLRYERELPNEEIENAGRSSLVEPQVRNRSRIPRLRPCRFPEPVFNSPAPMVHKIARAKSEQRLRQLSR